MTLADVWLHLWKTNIKLSIHIKQNGSKGNEAWNQSYEVSPFRAQMSFTLQTFQAQICFYLVLERAKIPRQFHVEVWIKWRTQWFSMTRIHIPKPFKVNIEQNVINKSLTKHLSKTVDSNRYTDKEKRSMLQQTITAAKIEIDRN